MRRRKASIYSIASNRSREMENEFIALARMARNEMLKGVTYVASNSGNELIMGSVGTHKYDPHRTIGVLFHAALALADAA